MMDFSKFRESGDLSDITVVVGTQDYKLHKFPLYARSDYFCELARSKPGVDSDPTRMELKDFPGGNQIFGQVADFCYNMSVGLTTANIVAIRCAAEYLKMYGPGNLKEVAHKFLVDTVSAAKLGRNAPSIIKLLMDCKETGELAKTAGIVDLCSEALLDCWLRPGGKPVALGNGSAFAKVSSLPKNDKSASAFTRVQNMPGQPATDGLDDASLNSLVLLPADWFATFLTKARIKGVTYEELGNLAVKYISNALRDDPNSKTRRSPAEVAPGAENGDSEIGRDADEEKDVDTNASSAGLQGTATAGSTSNNGLQADSSGTGFEGRSPKSDAEVGKILDKIVLVLPEQAFNIPAVTMEWLTKVLRVATSCGCECRANLVRVAGEMLTRLDPEDLCIISPSVLHDIVTDVDHKEKEGDASTSLQNERACKLVDTYMGQMTKKGVLTAETFKLLASATRNYARASHDPLFDVLDFVLKSEKDKLKPEQRKELTDLVNFNLLSEANLQRALDGEMVPANQVANCAIQLCSRLRSELTSIKYIAEMQEEDIQKYQTVATSAPKAVSQSPPLIADFRHFSSYTSRERNADSGYADVMNNSRDKSPLESLRTEDLDTSDSTTDPMKAAQSVLTAARHKLALPIYTGYRPALLTRLSPNTTSSHAHSHAHRVPAEHDSSLEEEPEFRYDRSFRSLDSRVRHHRLASHHHNHHHHNGGSGQRPYFHYTNYSHRF